MVETGKIWQHKMLCDEDNNINDINLYINTQAIHYDKKHSHTHFEFAFLQNGSILNNAQDKTERLTKNTLIAMRPECVHQLFIDGNNDYILFNIEVNCDFLRNVVKNMENMDIDNIFINPIYYLKCSDQEAIELNNLIMLAVQNQANKQKKQFCLKLLVVYLFTKLYIHLNDYKQQNTSPTINSVLDELKKPENFSLNTKQILAKINYSQEHIIRLFKNVGLDSPNKIFTKNKMDYACTLLSSSDMKIVNIAELCGIYSQNHFYYAFKKYFGISPTDYRKKFNFYKR